LKKSDSRLKKKRGFQKRGSQRRGRNIGKRLKSKKNQ
jgi:hypothetical protein